MGAAFDYNKAVEELEQLAARVEDPSSGIDDIGKYIRRADELVRRCREYLRSARDEADRMDKARPRDEAAGIGNPQ